MTNTYILNHDKLAESIEVCYTNGLLEVVTLPAKYPVTIKQYQMFLQHLPMSEELLEPNMGLIKIRISAPSKTYDKIKLFCDKYLQHKNNLKYKVMPKDTGKIKLVPVDAERLDRYFNSTAFEIVGKDGKGKHSISNYVDNFNQLEQEIHAPVKSKHPDFWNEKYEIGLKTQQEVNEYWAHLRSKNLAPKKDPVGRTIEWIAVDRIY